MIELSLRAPTYKRNHCEQLMKEFKWIMENLAKNKQGPNEQKWLDKLKNWTNAHPDEAKQLLFQVFGSDKTFHALILLKKEG
jgi:hypothetical protein